MSRDKATAVSRRTFFRVAAAGATATALGAGGATPVLAQSGDERTKARYQKTEHVEAYYRTNRYYPRGTN